MFDFSHLPQNAVVTEFVFSYPVTDTTQTVLRTWNKPPNAKLVFIYLIGQGGAGGSGASGAAGTSRSGGGGGAGGCTWQGLFPAHNIPSTLYIKPASQMIAISIFPFYGYMPSNTANVLGYALHGNNGTTNAAGAGQFGATEASGWRGSRLAIYWTGSNSQSGTWTTNGLPGSTSIGTGLPILGGGGGGGVLTGTPTVFNGAGFTSEIPAILPSIDGGLASSALNASSGVSLPFVRVGGAGGGANDNGPGGRGGNGVGYGAGGGGGGAGTTGGAGGAGGPAYACIIAW